MPILTVTPRFALVGVLAIAAIPLSASAQTPSPLAAWQYGSGILLEQYFEQPQIPTWRIRFGPALTFQPRYDGADSYHVLAGPSIDIRYKDEYFLSTGEGLGMNFLTGPNWRVGISMSYDLGRRSADDLDHLHGLENINAAPSIHLLSEYVISKSFPLVLRADLRRSIGGDRGVVGDLGAYMPMPGSSRTFHWFAGPTVTIADSQYMNSWFGVTPGESARSGLRTYNASAGVKSVGFGISATWMINKHWFVNGNTAIEQLVGSAANSPITQRSTSAVVAVSVDYNF
jgi:outer membrane scaffolding protein for murein synthesis (MipA/OmpV family)